MWDTFFAIFGTVIGVLLALSMVALPICLCVYLIRKSKK